MHVREGLIDEGFGGWVDRSGWLRVQMDRMMSYRLQGMVGLGAFTVLESNDLGGTCGFTSEHFCSRQCT